MDTTGIAQDRTALVQLAERRPQARRAPGADTRGDTQESSIPAAAFAAFILIYADFAAVDLAAWIHERLLNGSAGFSWAVACCTLAALRGVSGLLVGNGEQEKGRGTWAFTLAILVCFTSVSEVRPIGGTAGSESSWMALFSLTGGLIWLLESLTATLLQRAGLWRPYAIPTNEGSRRRRERVSGIFEQQRSEHRHFVRKYSIALVAKRTLDVLVASALMIALLPLFATIASGVCASGLPAIFRHKRVGMGGRLFYCYKFRTMVRGAEEQLPAILAGDSGARAEWERSFKLADDPRVTRFGRVLRRTSLDELPQLWNVFRGDMSLVGPRPVVPEELDRYGAARDLYLARRPGMTGLWQVEGRSGTSYIERVRLDERYMHSWSLSSDIRILGKTVGAVLNRVGAC